MLRLAVVSLAMAGMLGGSIKAGDRTPLGGMIDAERAFAKMSIDKSTRESFVANFADDATLLRPGPSNAQKWFSENPKWGLEGLLTWDPSFAVIADSGDVGYTTGPWQFRTARSLDAAPVANGYFVTIWKHTDAGWKVHFDHGVATPAPPSPIAPFSGTTAAMEPAPSKALAADAQLTLAKAESDFESAFAAKNGAAGVYEAFAGENVRIYRPGVLPVVGRSDVAQRTGSDSVSAWHAAETGVSKAGDLGYVFGTVDDSKSQAKGPGGFLRVWRRGSSGGWRIALDVLTPADAE